jgi:hypothetical protein
VRALPAVGTDPGQGATQRWVKQPNQLEIWRGVRRFSLIWRVN